MELDKLKKITLGVLLALIICAIISAIPKFIAIQKQISYTPENFIEEDKIPNKHRISAKRYKAYEEIFKTEGTILIYGYTPGALNDNLGTPFHEEITSYINENNKDIKVVAYKNWKNKKRDLENKYINNTSGCMMSTIQENLEDYLRFITECMNHVCLIKPNKKDYILISRDAQYIIQTLENLETLDK